MRGENCMATEKIAEKCWDYTLYRLESGLIVLSVLCGGAGVYELNVPLEFEEANKAILDQEFVEVYARRIRNYPDQYAHLSIPL